MKIEISKEEIDAEEILKRKINLFGNGSHIIIPKKYAGKTATILIHSKVGSWTKGYIKKYKNKLNKI